MHLKVLENRGALAYNLHTNVVALKINQLHLRGPRYNPLILREHQAFPQYLYAGLELPSPSLH